MKPLCFFVCIFFGSTAIGFGQKMVTNKHCYVVSFCEIYRSNILGSMNDTEYDNLYLLTSDKPCKIDWLMSSLSEKKFSSMNNILDTLKLYFNLYMIVENTSKNDSCKVSKLITNSNHYKAGYLFSLNDTIKKYSSVIGYVIQRFTFKGKIWYSVFNYDCTNFPYECPAVIEKIE